MPKTVAVVGASNDRRKFGNKAVRAFGARGYTVIPIYPHETTVEGLTAYRSVLDVPGPIEMATVYLPTVRVSKSSRTLPKRAFVKSGSIQGQTMTW